MGVKYTWEQANEIFKQHDLILLSLSYRKNDVPMYCCDQQGYIGLLSLNNLLRGRRFKKFRVNNLPKEVILYNVWHFCYLHRLQVEILDIELNQKRPKLTVRCECGRIYYPKLGKFTSLERFQVRCPYCTHKISSLEFKTENFFLKHNIQYQRQKTFQDCISNRTGNQLKFDFYLSDYNCCIECDGQQHFRQNAFGAMTFDEYSILKQYDQIKTKYCQDHNIRLLRLSYKLYNKQEKYKQILTDFLQLI